MEQVEQVEHVSQFNHLKWNSKTDLRNIFPKSDYTLGPSRCRWASVGVVVHRVVQTLVTDVTG